VKIISEIRDFYPPVINDDKLYEKVFNSLDNDLVEIIQQMMLAEDFSYYQKEIPGLFVMLGCKNENLGFVNSLHSCYFNFDEKVLLSGLNYFKKICEIFANQ
jgi:metal-dependent amidase/aminoacylase/carboxypeptidase family protein